jgi:hypothetical protein
VKDTIVIVNRFHLLNGGDRREGNLITCNGVEEMQLGPLVGGDNPAMAGTDHVSTTNRWVWERQCARLVLRETVETCNVLTGRFTSVEQAWCLGLFILPKLAQGGVYGSPGGANRTSTNEVRDLKGGKYINQDIAW